MYTNEVIGTSEECASPKHAEHVDVFIHKTLPFLWKIRSHRIVQEGFQFFIKTEKSRGRQRKWDGVGVLKEKELKLEEVQAPHTLSGKFHHPFEIHKRAWPYFTCLLKTGGFWEFWVGRYISIIISFWNLSFSSSEHILYIIVLFVGVEPYLCTLVLEFSCKGAGPIPVILTRRYRQCQDTPQFNQVFKHFGKAGYQAVWVTTHHAMQSRYRFGRSHRFQRYFHCTKRPVSWPENLWPLTCLCSKANACRRVWTGAIARVWPFRSTHTSSNRNVIKPER